MNIIQQIIAALTLPELIDRSDGRQGRMLPPGWATEYDDNRTVEAPKFLSASRSLHTTTDLADYCKSFNINPVIWLDRDQLSITAIMDPITENALTFERHMATLKFLKTPSYKAWSSTVDKWMSPREFAYFLEDHLDDITGEFSGSKVLSMARDLNIKMTGDTTMQADITSGSRTVKFELNNKLVGNETTFPEYIDVTIPVFRYTNAVEFKVRLRADVRQDGPVFQFVMPEDELVVDKTFENVLQGLKAMFSDGGEFYYGSPNRAG